MFAGCTASQPSLKRSESQEIRGSFVVARSVSPAGTGERSARQSVPVQQGVPLNYEIISEGSAVVVTVIGGFKVEAVIERKEGREIRGRITTDYSGLMDFRIEAIGEGTSRVAFRAW